MKKLLTLIALTCLFNISLSAQFTFGAGISINVDDSFFGLSGKGHYQINDEYAGQASLTYFLENNNVSFFIVDLDVIYNGFNIGDLEGFSIKALGGLQVASASVDTGFGSASDTELGLNVGVNAVIPLTDRLDLYIEPKFVISGIDGFVISGGVYF